MPLSQNPTVEWPTERRHLLQGLQITTGSNGTRYSHLDLDVDSETLFMLNDFEARVLHRQVRLRLADDAACFGGEMNVLVGLGAAADPTRHVGRIRISFHDIQDDSCVDPVFQA
jgi:hypothetical protein